MNRNNALKKLVLAALFVALDLLFTRVFCVYLMGGAERVSLQTLASAVCGWALGPWWGAGVAAAADLLGSAVGTSGLSFFPGFTLTAALRGLTYGLLLYLRPSGSSPHVRPGLPTRSHRLRTESERSSQRGIPGSLLPESG